jgi:ankyrin repeat protein
MRDVSPSFKDGFGNTPLDMAATRGFFQRVKLLLEHSADPSVQDGKGRTPAELYHAEPMRPLLNA